MLGSLLDVWRSLTDPDRLIHLLTQVLTGWLGYAMLASIVFAETGLLVGLFLPGDTLLFTVGVVCGSGDLDIVKICSLLLTGGFDYRRPERIFSRISHGSEDFLASRFAIFQARVRPADAGIL